MSRKLREVWGRYFVEFDDESDSFLFVQVMGLQDYKRKKRKLKQKMFVSYFFHTDGSSSFVVLNSNLMVQCWEKYSQRHEYTNRQTCTDKNALIQPYEGDYYYYYFWHMLLHITLFFDINCCMYMLAYWVYTGRGSLTFNAWSHLQKA